MIKQSDQKKNILLVEDDFSVSQMLKLLLEARGYQVTTASSAQETYQKISQCIDLVLLDLLLPDEDGFIVCRKLKRNKASQHIPVIILSAKILSKDIIEGLYMGADDYLTKPFDYDELVARMEAVMRRGSVFQAQTRGAIREEDIIGELRHILDRELVQPVFQPIYFFNDYRIFGLEVLCRLKTGANIITNPEILFKFAVKYGFYEELEMLLWRKAIIYALPHLKEEKLFLNCNPYLVEGEKFAEIKALFESTKMKQENVVLEITERSAIGEYKAFYNSLSKFREIGFQFAVDDVGGGYASLESIVETKPEIVKIDRHITIDVHKDSFKKSIVKFIVAFCKDNNVISIAEGIETKEALETLKQLGVDAGQGYFFYKPTLQINIPQMLQAARNQTA